MADLPVTSIKPTVGPEDIPVAATVGPEDTPVAATVAPENTQTRGYTNKAAKEETAKKGCLGGKKKTSLLQETEDQRKQRNRPAK
ncbi:hypothetical protein PR048_012229 [Dryococelus australis]|uniref:Uncharacterized protein n=1 Tax=Dryococelus australis TaxID=614101 RepID=A0ABQ9HNU2_9NEOP|nr:hypothetical protein PR048_012229 [Dryococelus australis]